MRSTRWVQQRGAHPAKHMECDPFMQSQASFTTKLTQTCYAERWQRSSEWGKDVSPTGGLLWICFFSASSSAAGFRVCRFARLTLC